MAARFWNLIYKDHYHGAKKPASGESPGEKHNASRAQSLTVTSVDREFAEALADKFRFEFSSLHDLLATSKQSLEKYQLNQANFLPFAGGSDFPKGSIQNS